MNEETVKKIMNLDKETVKKIHEAYSDTHGYEIEDLSQYLRRTTDDSFEKIIIEEIGYGFACYFAKEKIILDGSSIMRKAAEYAPCTYLRYFLEDASLDYIDKHLHIAPGLIYEREEDLSKNQKDLLWYYMKVGGYESYFDIDHLKSYDVRVVRIEDNGGYARYGISGIQEGDICQDEDGEILYYMEGRMFEYYRVDGHDCAVLYSSQEERLATVTRDGKKLRVNNPSVQREKKYLSIEETEKIFQELTKGHIFRDPLEGRGISFAEWYTTGLGAYFEIQAYMEVNHNGDWITPSERNRMGVFGAQSMIPLPTFPEIYIPHLEWKYSKNEGENCG